MLRVSRDNMRVDWDYEGAVVTHTPATRFSRRNCPSFSVHFSRPLTDLATTPGWLHFTFVILRMWMLWKSDWQGEGMVWRNTSCSTPCPLCWNTIVNQRPWELEILSPFLVVHWFRLHVCYRSQQPVFFLLHGWKHQEHIIPCSSFLLIYFVYFYFR